MITENLDILLLSMPVRAIDRPSLSLPVLSAHLEKQGFNVLQMDNNVYLQDKLIEVDSLQLLLSEILPLLIRINSNSKDTSIKLKSFYSVLDKINKSYGFEKLVLLKNKMQTNEFQFLTELENVKIVEDIFLVSSHLRFYFTTVTYYFDYYSENKISEIVSLEMNKLFSKIERVKPFMVGFSVIEVQRPFSLWVSEKLRERYDGYILFGGSDVSLNKESYLEENPSIDFACWSDGEESLTKLLNELKTNKSEFLEIPNLAYRKDGMTVVTEYEGFPLEKFNIPTYRNLPLEKYIFPSMQILTSKGCLWSKCMFCMHWNSYGQSFRQRCVEKVVDEIQENVGIYGVRLFSIVDEAISAEYAVALSKEIIKRKLDIRWIQMSRLDSDFNRSVFEIMHKAGCRLIEWGLESGSQKVLDDMKKGIDISHVQRIISESASTGIINKMLMFHNYPTETVEDLMKSINIIRKNTYERLMKPMLALRHSFVLKYGSPLSAIAFNESKDKDKLFKKVWKSDSVYNVNAKYLSFNSNTEVKKRLVNDYLNEMKSYLDSNNVLITNNDNITMDLVLIQLIEMGYELPVDVFLPNRNDSLDFESFNEELIVC